MSVEEPFRKGRSFYWAIACLSIPLWWWSGLILVFYQLFAILLFAHFLFVHQKNERLLYIPQSVHALGFFIFLYGCSLVLNFFQSDFVRIMASLYNLSYWIMGICLMVVLSNLTWESCGKKIEKVFMVLAFFFAMAFLIIFPFGLWKGTSVLIVHTPLMERAGEWKEIALISHSLEMQFLVPDWFNSQPWPRFNFLSPYPTATSATLGIILIFLYALYPLKKVSEKLWLIFLYVINLTAVVANVSRLSILAFSIGFGIVFLSSFQKRGFWVLFLFFMMAFCYPLIEHFVHWILQLREGSTMGRMQLYQDTLEILSGVQWFFGLGIKPRTFESALPLATHSTYLSLLVKTGWAGLFAFICFQAGMILRWWYLLKYIRNNALALHWWRAFGWMILFMTLWVWTEDLDAPQFLAFLYFSMLGFFESFRRKWRYEFKDS